MITLLNFHLMKAIYPNVVNKWKRHMVLLFNYPGLGIDFRKSNTLFLEKKKLKAYQENND